MPQRVILGSGGFRTEARIKRFAAKVESVVSASTKLLVIPFASSDPAAVKKTLTERKLCGERTLQSLLDAKNPAEAIAQAKAILVPGGNTYRLLNELQMRKLLAPIQERVRNGCPYFGISAGTNIACPTIQTTNDMPIVIPASTKGLGFVPFQINPHYFEGATHVKTDKGFVKHFGETRDDRIREFQSVNSIDVVGLWEGGIMDINDQTVELSAAPARYFPLGKKPFDLQVGQIWTLGQVPTLPKK